MKTRRVLNQTANDAFLRGKAINDEELKSLLDFYEEAYNNLVQFDPLFRPSANELLDRLNTLRYYQQTRKESPLWKF